MSRHEERQRLDLLARDREAWNLPAPKLRGIGAAAVELLAEDEQDEPTEAPELDPAA